MQRLKQLEHENNKLRNVVADLSLDKEMLQDAEHFFGRERFDSLVYKKRK
jgi:hypothetical protein